MDLSFVAEALAQWAGQGISAYGGLLLSLVPAMLVIWAMTLLNKQPS